MSREEIPTAEEKLKIARFLSFIDIFRQMDPTELLTLADGMVFLHLASGEILIHQGDIDGSIFIVYQGRLRVFHERESGHIHQKTILADISQGFVIGEIAFLTGLPRSGSVMALREAVVLKLAANKTAVFGKKYPQALYRLAQTSIIRLLEERQKSKRLQEISTITVAFAGGSASDLLIQDLMIQLNQTNSTFLVTRKSVQDYFDPKFSLDALQESEWNRFNQWFMEVEQQYQYVVLVPDNTLSVWTEYCFCHADYILFIGYADDDTSLNKIESSDLMKRLNDIGLPCHLMLMRPENTENQAFTKKWTDPRPYLELTFNQIQGNPDFSPVIRAIHRERLGVVLFGSCLSLLVQVAFLKHSVELSGGVDYLFGSGLGYYLGCVYATHGWETLLEVVLSPEFLALHDVEAHHLPQKYNTFYQKISPLLRGRFLEDQVIECVGCSSSEIIFPLVVHLSGESMANGIQDLFHGIEQRKDFFNLYKNYLTDDRIIHEAKEHLKRGYLTTAYLHLQECPLDIAFEGSHEDIHGYMHQYQEQNIQKIDRAFAVEIEFVEHLTLETAKAIIEHAYRTIEERVYLLHSRS